jgi:hypothetical protein
MNNKPTLITLTAKEVYSVVGGIQQTPVHYQRPFCTLDIHCQYSLGKPVTRKYPE